MARDGRKQTGRISDIYPGCKKPSLLMSKPVISAVFIILAFARGLVPAHACAQVQQAPPQQSPAVTRANYASFARFSPKKLEKMIFSVAVDPPWLKKTDRFWYMFETTEGKKWYIVDPTKGEKKL